MKICGNNTYVPDTIKVVAADDHRLFLEGLDSLFQRIPNFSLIHTCEDGDTLLHLIEQDRPHIALIDLSMPGAGTEEIVKTVDENNWNTKLIALTMHHEPHYAQQLLKLGLSGYVLKDEAFDELNNAISAVQSDEQFISPSLTKLIIEANRKKKAELSLLTSREIEVLENAAKGQSNKEIARSIDISERTVRFHISNCCLKLEAQGRSNAVAKAMQMELIKL